MYQDAWKRFYVANSRPDEGTGWLRGTNLVLMTSAGRLLEGAMTYGDRGSLAQALQQVLDAYAKLPKAQRRAESVDSEVKPQIPPPEGGLVLTIYDRPLGRDTDRKYRLPEEDDLGGLQTHAPHAQRSSLWLTHDECQSLIPPSPESGQTLDVPAQLAKRIWLYGLVPQSLWVVEEFWKPDSVHAGKLQVTVENVSPDCMNLRMHGSVVLSGPGVLHTWPDRKFIKNVENRYDARLEGTIVVDRTRQTIVRWDMAALGDYTGRWFAGNKGWQEATAQTPLSLGFAFELDQSAYQLPPDRRRPRSFVYAYIFRDREQYYWNPDEWLADWQQKQKPAKQ